MSNSTTDPTGRTVSSRLARGLVRYAVSHGADETALLSASGIDPAVLRDANGRVPITQQGRLWSAAVAGTGDADLGLHHGARPTSAFPSLVRFVLLTAPTLGDAFADLVRYRALVGEGVGLRLDPGGDGRAAYMELHPDASIYLVDQHRQLPEHVLASLMSVTAGVTGRRLPALSVAFVHPRPATGTAAHEAAFGVAPTFGAGVSRLVFEPAALRWPNPEANPRLHTMLQHDADMVAEQLHPSLRQRVARAVAQQVRVSLPTLADVAADLGVGERSLQRHLGDEGATFHGVVDDVRQEIARHHLERDGSTIHEVAFLLGYSEPSAFHRAFKRWTGLTPTAYRETSVHEKT